jgi:hypothetical protein
MSKREFKDWNPNGNEAPTSKTQLTKSKMITYIAKHTSDEDKKFWSEYLANKENQETKTKKLGDGETIEYQDIKLQAFRTAFCQKHFPDLGKKKEDIYDIKAMLKELNEKKD